MKSVLLTFIALFAFKSNADVVTTNVNYLHVSVAECNGGTNYQGLIADGWGLIVAEVEVGNESYSARPYPIYLSDLKTICSDFSKIGEFDLIIRNLGMFEGGIIVGIKKKGSDIHLN